MKKVLMRHTISFKHAIDGIIYSFTTQPNFIIHTILALTAIVLGFVFRITRIEFTIIIFTIVLGFTGEMINTAIESVTDLVTSEWRQSARIAKDVSAGMMLLIAVGAISVAVYIFIPYIFART